MAGRPECIKNKKSGLFVLKIDYRQVAGRPDAVFRGTEQPLPPRPAAIPGFWPRRNEKSGLFVLKIDYRQVAGRPDAVFRVQYKPLHAPPGGDSGVLAAKKRKNLAFLS